MNNPKVSVIIPVYGVEKYIRECVESVINQTLKDIEIIVVNDGTKDNSIKIVEEYLQDKRIKIINKENGGLSSARNVGIKIAVGKYIYNLDADDFISLDILEKLYIKAEKESLDVVIFDINFYSDKLKKNIGVWKDTNLKENKVYLGEEYLKEYFLGNGCPAIWNKLWRRNLYIKNKIFHPENISYGEDGSTMTRLMLETKRIGKLNETGYYYRQRETSMTKKTGIKMTDYLISYNITIEYLKERNKLQKFQKYLDTYKYKYIYIMLFNYNYADVENKYIKEVYKEFFEDIKKLKVLNISLKHKILIKAYKINIKLGNFIVRLNLMKKTGNRNEEQ